MKIKTINVLEFKMQFCHVKSKKLSLSSLQQWKAEKPKISYFLYSSENWGCRANCPCPPNSEEAKEPKQSHLRSAYKSRSYWNHKLAGTLKW